MPTLPLHSLMSFWRSGEYTRTSPWVPGVPTKILISSLGMWRYPPTESWKHSLLRRGSLEIDIQVTEPEPEPSCFGGEALDTYSIGGRKYQVLAHLQGREEASIIVENEEEEVKENVRKKRRRKRRRKQRKRPGGPVALRSTEVGPVTSLLIWGNPSRSPVALGSQVSCNFKYQVSSPI